MLIERLPAVDKIAEENHPPASVLIAATFFFIPQMSEQIPQLSGMSVNVSNNVVDTTSFSLDSWF